MGWGGYRGYGDYGFREYVSVAQKQAMAVTRAAQVAKKEGRLPAPVMLEKKKIATTFWGTAWCKNLESYSDFSNRLPRGATYVRNGSVVDLVIKPRSIQAIVAGSETYNVTITIEGLKSPQWKKIRSDCSASIDSLLDLLAGRFSDGVMQRLTQPKEGLFPSPNEINMECSCPDYSYCCKHLAAVMYGVGNRLDKQPELLFLLRGVDHQELVSQAISKGNLERELSNKSESALAGEDLGALFGIELDTTPSAASVPSPTPAAKSKAAKKAPVKKAKKKKTSAKKATARKKAATKKKTPRKGK